MYRSDMPATVFQDVERKIQAMVMANAAVSERPLPAGIGVGKPMEIGTRSRAELKQIEAEPGVVDVRTVGNKDSAQDWLGDNNRGAGQRAAAQCANQPAGQADEVFLDSERPEHVGPVRNGNAKQPAMFARNAKLSRKIGGCRIKAITAMQNRAEESAGRDVYKNLRGGSNRRRNPGYAEAGEHEEQIHAEPPMSNRGRAENRTLRVHRSRGLCIGAENVGSDHQHGDGANPVRFWNVGRQRGRG